MDEEIDCDFTDEIVCPHCGYKHDPTDYYVDFATVEDQQYECVECNQPFFASMYTEISFSTKPVPAAAKETTCYPFSTNTCEKPGCTCREEKRAAGAAAKGATDGH